VTYAVSGSRLVSAIDHKPKRVPAGELARVRWLRARPRAALTIDHYDDEWSKLAWVQALGDVRVLEAASEPDAILMSWFGHPAVASSPGAGWLLFWLRILSYSAVTMAYLGLGALLLRGVRGSRAATTVLMVLAGLTLLPFSGNVGEYPMPGQALPFVGEHDMARLIGLAPQRVDVHLALLLGANRDDLRL